MSRTRLFRQASAALCLTAGVLIYYIWRPEGILHGILWKSRTAEAIPSGWLWDLIIYSLPDGLWYAALLCIQPSADETRHRTFSAILRNVAIALPFIHEASQYAGLMPGTFCIKDIIIYSFILTIYLSICCTKAFPRKRAT